MEQEGRSGVEDRRSCNLRCRGVGGRIEVKLVEGGVEYEGSWS